IEARGTVSGLPAAGVNLPLPPGTSVALPLTVISGVDVAVVLPSRTKVEDGPIDLPHGAGVHVEAAFRGRQLLVTVVAAQDDQPQDGNDQGQNGDDQGDQGKGGDQGDQQ